MMDMTSHELTEIKSTGFSGGICHHAAIPVPSSKFVFVVGGTVSGESAGQVKIFDAKDLRWESSNPILPTVGGGLIMHRAINFAKKNGALVLCLGGYVDSPSQPHPSHMAIFDISL